MHEIEIVDDPTPGIGGGYSPNAVCHHVQAEIKYRVIDGEIEIWDVDPMDLHDRFQDEIFEAATKHAANTSERA